MARKKGIKLLTELVNLEGIKVISQSQYERIGIILQLEPIGQESICPRCRTKSHRVHQNHRYIVKDLPGDMANQRENRDCWCCDNVYRDRLPSVLEIKTKSPKLQEKASPRIFSKY